MYFSPEDLDMGLKKGENILPCLPLVSSSSAVGKSPGSEFVPGPSCSAENMKYIFMWQIRPTGDTA